MKKCQILYRASTGEITKRIISGWTATQEQGTVAAFCHLRKDTRYFRLTSMIEILDLDTNQTISNPWDYFEILPTQKANSTSTHNYSLDTVTWPALAAIKAIKLFTLSTRGFRKRERLRVVEFVARIVDTSKFSEADIETWVTQLWCGDVYALRRGNTQEYEELLRLVPIHLRAKCRICATVIASGSGRNAINPKWKERIDLEFSQYPQVRVDLLQDDPEQESDKQKASRQPSTSVEISASKLDAFLALDVETANSNRWSICSIGMAVFRKKKLAYEFYTLVNPQTHFDGGNIAIHGITPEMVKSAPTLKQLADHMWDALHGVIVVAHSPFDKSALNSASDRLAVSRPQCTWLDTCKISREVWPEFLGKGYGLLNMCSRIGYEFSHHHALEDAKAAAAVLLAAMDKSGHSLDYFASRQ